MIRILHSVSNMDRAGIETMLMNYYRYIDREKIQFDFLCNKIKPGAYDGEILSMGGRIFHTPGLNPLKYRKYLSYMTNLFEDNPDYKIIEAHNGALGVYALHAAKVNHVPIRIFHAHGASITRDWKRPIKLVCKTLLPFNMNQRFSCGIAAAECYFGQKITAAGAYTLVPNAIEAERFVYNQKIRDKIRQKNGLKDKYVIGHVGRFMKQKNHIFLLDVFTELLKREKKVRLVLLGDGELMEDVKKRAKKSNVFDAITFVGNVGNANEWYQAFDCFVLPSIWEGLPVVGIEAQAADLPCVFSDAVTKEVKMSDRVKFVSLEAPISVWVDNIQKALEDGRRNNNYSLIKSKNYDIKTEAIKLENLYLRLSEENL